MSSQNIMQASNRLKAAFDEGRQSLGVWQMLPGANLSRTLARSGVDWVVVDCEHGNIDDAAMHESVPAIAAAGASPFIRIPDKQSWMIKRALDTGAHGVVVPLLRTVQDAKDIVQYAKYPPQGERGFGAVLAPERFASQPTSVQYLQQANDALLTIVQIETKEALEVVDEIAAVDGIDVLFIGPFDLGNNIGHPLISAVPPPELVAAIGKIFAAAKKAGKKCGMFTAGRGGSKAIAEQGFDMICVATDINALDQVIRSELAIAKGST